LTALGFNSGGVDGVFNPRTREMIASWQRGKNYLATGFLSGTQHQALLREAAPALARYDEDQKKAEEAKKKSDEERAKAEAAAKAAQTAATPNQQAALAPAPAAAAARGPGADGLWHGTYRCTPSRHGGDFNINFQVQVSGGMGTWVRPGSGPGTQGNQSITVTIRGNRAQVARSYIPQNQPGLVNTAQLTVPYDGANTISGGGAEQYSGGRTCQILLSR
jgi:hypothetical protein